MADGDVIPSIRVEQCSGDDHGGERKNSALSGDRKMNQQGNSNRMSCEYDIITNSMELEGIICDIEMDSMDCAKEAWSPRVVRTKSRVVGELYSRFEQMSPVRLQKREEDQHEQTTSQLEEDGLCGPCRYHTHISLRSSSSCTCVSGSGPW